uniref:Uncharacterized protein n=1 Tax=Spongospora subterranea TaxID=70186 RepID=A0A0H5RDU4_9EUKA|eukprot:CRZ12173.1 hypothetical protein [Spongospora subterranea]
MGSPAKRGSIKSKKAAGEPNRFRDSQYGTLREIMIGSVDRADRRSDSGLSTYPWSKSQTARGATRVANSKKGGRTNQGTGRYVGRRQSQIAQKKQGLSAFTWAITARIK